MSTTETLGFRCGIEAGEYSGLLVFITSDIIMDGLTIHTFQTATSQPTNRDTQFAK